MKLLLTVLTIVTLAVGCARTCPLPVLSGTPAEKAKQLVPLTEYKTIPEK